MALSRLQALICLVGLVETYLDQMLRHRLQWQLAWPWLTQGGRGEEKVS